MIPGGDHSSRSLLFRRIRSWSEITHRSPRDDNGDNDGEDHLHRRPLLANTNNDENNGNEMGSNNGDTTSPLLPHGLSFEYEEQSHQSSVDDVRLEDQESHHPHRYCCRSTTLTSTDWKLWIVFGLLVASGVGNVIFAKLQSLPM
jgi:hypothetical protein